MLWMLDYVTRSTSCDNYNNNNNKIHILCFIVVRCKNLIPCIWYFYDERSTFVSLQVELLAVLVVSDWKWFLTTHNGIFCCEHHCWAVENSKHTKAYSFPNRIVFHALYLSKWPFILQCIVCIYVRSDRYNCILNVAIC